ncbi:galactosyl transferase GMA12/MNN10 family-domain-containing protein [Geopyxis carbonaria]|nr:galactosyl transferase GMA12/MNN10 family-domain-containing protein [Geopyxis carbonaria]
MLSRPLTLSLLFLLLLASCAILYTSTGLDGTRAPPSAGLTVVSVAAERPTPEMVVGGTQGQSEAKRLAREKQLQKEREEAERREAEARRMAAEKKKGEAEKKEKQRKMEEKNKLKAEAAEALRNAVVTLPHFASTAVSPRPGTDDSSLIILTGTDGHGHNTNMSRVLQQALLNRRSYAALHGYTSHFLNISSFELPTHVKPVWAKLPALISTFNTFPSAEWIWWLDLDAIIMTPSLPLDPPALAARALTNETLLKATTPTRLVRTPHSYPVNGTHIDLLFTQDQNGINAGSFLVRRSSFTQLFLDLWADPLLVRENWIGQEQDALVHLLRYHKAVREHVGFVPQREINAYHSEDKEERRWRTGDRVVHFAGCWVKGECDVHWEKHWRGREVVEGSLEDLEGRGL